MAVRIAACLALVAFAVCILSGLQAGNPFSTVVSTALIALVVTYGVGLLVGTMAKRMLDENLAAAAKNSPNSQAKQTPSDR